jgi:hypothetical protein
MKKLLLSFLLLSVFASAQHETDKWYFGVLAGIDFSSGSAVAISGGQVNTPEGSAIMSNAGTGALMFYTDGLSVWDSTHTVMPNGTGLLGASSSTQAALIIPQPGSSTLFYIFTTDEIGGANGLRYSVVDMSLQGGLGDVTVKNVSLLSVVTEKLTAVKDQATGEFWIVAHKWGNDAFYAYKLTSAGVSAPVITNIGIVHNNSMIQNTYGQMKFNGCGSKLACAIGYQDTIQLFDFNPATGVLSNEISIPMADHVYGIEFSPDGSKFYASMYGSFQTLFQFDISSGVQSTIMASKIPLSITSDTYALQLANDGKIYVVKSFSQFLGVINSPNTAGASCNYVDFGFDLDPNFVGATSSLGLPNFVQSFFNNEAGCVFASADENNSELSLSVYPNPSSGDFSFKAQKDYSSVMVLDLSGRQVEAFFTVKSGSIVNFGSKYAEGFYFLKLSDGNKAFSVPLVKISD